LSRTFPERCISSTESFDYLDCTELSKTTAKRAGDLLDTIPHLRRPPLRCISSHLLFENLPS
jgi:hypothetical protein